MFRPKRLYGFMLQSFLPVFFMTFFICLFIVLMQFLWKYVDEMVGKGLEISVLLELFFYAAVTMVPLALPLSILLASLMTFGNLGERFELLAIKAAGVSLLHVMRPLIFLVSVIAVLAFFFQNDVLPQAQVKMWTLIYSVRQKSPELDIPEGVFYDEISGYNLYVKKKDRDTGIMYNMMIYDMSKGFDNATIVLADSGRLRTTADKKHLVLTLYDGESFENLQTNRTNTYNNIPYRRETFSFKEFLINFDANFNRLDDGLMQGQYVGKNYTELRTSIDSMNQVVDSLGANYASRLQVSGYFGMYKNDQDRRREMSPQQQQQEEAALQQAAQSIDLDSLWQGENNQRRQLYVARALERAQTYKNDYSFNSMTVADKRFTIRRHEIELMKKFTLSLACIIFFFIGAPLGAIIRKGGLGVPIVVSVILFIIYYIIDNTGYKMARDGVWPVWQGIWLSSAVLLPLGIFLTSRATKDSAVLNLDAYSDFFRQLFGKAGVRKVELKEIVLAPMSPVVAEEKARKLTDMCNAFLHNNAKLGYVAFWTKGYDMQAIKNLATVTNSLVEYTSETTDRMVATKLMDYPVIVPEWMLRPVHIRAIAIIVMIFFPVGLPLYWIASRRYAHLAAAVKTIVESNEDLITLLHKMKPEYEQNR